MINMNGRVYDPAIGRFLTADPFIQAPDNLQSFNRYAYVLNNPLAYTDPSGYFSYSVGGPNSPPNSGNTYTYTNSDGTQSNYGCSACGSHSPSSPSYQAPAGSNGSNGSTGSHRKPSGSTATVTLSTDVKVPPKYEEVFRQDNYPLLSLVRQTLQDIAQLARALEKVGEFGYGSLSGDDVKSSAAMKYLDENQTENIGALLGLGLSLRGGAAKGANSLGYHATLPEAAESIMAGGFRVGTKPGRLGSDGVYVNSTPKGAIAEFAHHNPGIKPSVLEVQYSAGKNARAGVAPRSYVTEHPLNVDSISAPSVRAPGTTNTNILNGTATPLRIR